MSAASGTAPGRTELLELLEDAARAPSMYNAQPWRWRADEGRLALYADRGRRVPVADPDDRFLVLGCGAALHHLRVAAGGRGLVAHVQVLPDPDDSDLLATVVLERGPVEQDHRLLPALRSRRTDRRRATSWPVPPERVEHLAALAAAEGSTALAVTDPARRHRVEALVARALAEAGDDDAHVAEQQAWLDREPRSGVPLATVPRLLPRTAGRRSRFGPGLLAQPDREPGEPDDGDGLLLLAGADTVASWLGTGQALSAAWLHAEATGLSAVPLSQVVEVPATRRALAEELDAGLVPHLVVRLGWLSPSRDRLAPTPRRAVADQLVP